jgi:tight adherence protein B
VTATAGAFLAGMTTLLLLGGRRAPADVLRPPVRPSGGLRPAPGSRSALTSPVTAGVAVVAGALILGVPLLLLPTIGLVGWLVLTLLLRARGDRQADRRRTAVVDACEALLGELLAGRPPAAAVEGAAQVWSELTPAAGAAHLGADVPSCLRELSLLPGAVALGRVAGAWQLCSATGSGLAAALEEVLATVRADHEVALAVRSELASARATARLLAVLPVLVLVMGEGIGAEPWSFLLATTPGQLCLLAGALLAVTGVLWLERIADEAVGERR